MNETKNMRRISIYIEENLVNEVQKIAQKERRSLSFWVADLIEKTVNRKLANKSESK